jgi:HD-GYP domain-containing protein (c-di-GMP phosphodiesterase class II)
MLYEAPLILPAAPEPSQRFRAASISLYPSAHVPRDARAAAETAVNAWLVVMGMREPSSCAHARRVGWLARGVGQSLGLSAELVDALDWAGRLHDIGKLGISDELLNKPTKLTEREFERIKLHPRLGYELLRNQPALAGTLEGVLYHHENYDGSGYPCGLQGTEIPLAARILRVVDSFDAMTSERPYRKPLSFRMALEELKRAAGTATDPRITSVFCDLLIAMRRGDPNALTNARTESLLTVPN